MQSLTIVNRCLATVGEKALASLEEPHAFKGDALTILSEENKAVQATGWWFNTEAQTLAPMLNGRIALAGDTISVRTKDPNIVQRGQYLYDSLNGTDLFEDSVEVLLIRLVPFEDLPETVAEYIGWSTAFNFQFNIDGDQLRSQQLEKKTMQARASAKSDDIRNKHVNVIWSNPRLLILKVRNQQIRRW